jgi:ubiquinone biosynthesis protein UbiJ
MTETAENSPLATDQTPAAPDSNANTANPLERAVIGGLNKAAQKALELDPVARKKLRALAGKVVQLRLKPLGITLFILPEADGLRILSRYAGPVDTVIEGTPLALFAMGADSPVTGLTPVRIEGDASTGQHLAKWLKTLRPDWEEALCQVFGDGPGVRMAKTLRAGADFGRRVLDTLLRSTTEYLTEESREVVTSHELEPFYEAVDDLKADSQRLERRIARLQAQLGAEKTGKA